MSNYQTDDCGKSIVEDPPQPKPLATLNSHIKSIANMKRSLALMSSLVEAQVTTSTPPSKKKKVEELVPQVDMFHIKDKILKRNHSLLTFHA